MQMLAGQVKGYMDKSSWIRKMFEAGAELKAQYGEDAVCDFSLGNPDLAPPAAVGRALRQLADEAGQPFFFGYMQNAGYPFARQRLAEQLSLEQGVDVTEKDVCITCGAAGAINCFFRAVLDPGDEVLCPAPYFVEYGFYVENYGGTLKSVPCRVPDFSLDLAAFDAAITDKTRVVMVNSPNNPTGQIYSEAELRQLAAILTRHNEGRERPIYLLSDEPYRFLAFDGADVPSILPLYPYAVVASSFSKNLSMAGARVGYAVVNPAMPGGAELMNGIILANRILGFVNAPSLAQKVLARCMGTQVPVDVYARRRDAMAEVLTGAGIEFTMPKGAFYFFPAAPGGDDLAFVQALVKERILVVPGRGFGFPGYVRLAFCVGETVIRRAADGFKRAADSLR